MENASKALIIAGAILISILLISVAIMVISSTQGTQDQMAQQMDATEKSSFNAQFTNFSGTGRTATQVKMLFEKVTSSNAANSNLVKMTVSNTSTAATAQVTAADITNLSNSKKYKVVVEDKGVASGTVTAVTVSGTPDGLYDTITVTAEN